MTLTIIDGDFPREVLAGQNLTFASYRMPQRRNRAGAYDSKLKGPAPRKQGILKLGAFRGDSAPRAPQISGRTRWLVPLGLLVFGLVTFVATRPRTR